MKIFSERDQFELLRTRIEYNVLEVLAKKFVFELNLMEFDEIDFC